MDLVTLRHFFAWCTVFNYAVLLFWFALHMGAHSWLVGLSQRFFRVTPERYDSASYYGMMFYKLGIFLFNLGPYVALRIMA